jgi:preprotein translocase subunit SecG
MTTVVIVIHLMVVLAMVGLVLLQRSEGGALGIGGGQGAFLSGRSAGNVLTRTTAILAIAFFATSLGLALLAKYQSRPGDILERLPGQSAPAATETPAPPQPAGGPPATAEELLQQLGGGGPQTPPADTNSGSAPAPAAPAPAENAPAAEGAAGTPAAPAGGAPSEPAPAPQTPPATGGSTQ